ncbi:MAG: hypothetical protein ACTSWR_02525, partial [Candidatus Helarchaeota archaeon]
MSEDGEFLQINETIIREKITEIDYELQEANLKNFLSDLDEFINLLATYAGDKQDIGNFIEELISRLSSKSNLDHYDLFLYHVHIKIAEYYSLSK